ncbi:hypothetical protein pdam_00018448 [Pocillopora damicornis]|uniref:EF-hand domain-containing protein n=1 Tax=Pocillopora damicornis TaxID=46731 RepID=A0A3M6UBI7_POCDA|nr:GRIP and coiled-coil domain-containing protein 2-like [Pocillopora damicornis]RMX51012.1 hypothetical protein pdam_00018448 [Pocillopora damicornis]
MSTIARGHPSKDDASSVEMKKKTKEMKIRVAKMFDLFDKVIEFNHNPTSESAKRRLDLEIEKLKTLQQQLEKEPQKIDLFEENLKDVQEYDKFYIQYVNHVSQDLENLKNSIIQYIQEKTKAEQLLAKENMKLKLDFQREQAESMHQQQKHEYAVAEKNTVLATCRKLEEQLEERGKQIQQLQREGTVSLWQREKAKLIKDVHSSEERLAKELKETKDQLEDTKSRLNQRIMELMDQVKYLKMEKDVKNGTVRTCGAVPHVSSSEMEKIKQQLFLKDRLLVVAEGEIQKQQKYYVGFISGLSRDFRIMLERQHLTVKEYNKDQKAYASMLNKMYVAAKEGTLTEFRATLPSHYLGINEDLSGHPLGKKLSRPFEDLELHLQEVEDSEFRIDINHPLLTGWREGRSASARENVRKFSKKSSKVTGVHPRLVDTKLGKPLIKEAKEHFPEWSDEEIQMMFEQFKRFDTNDDFNLDTQELLRAIPDTLGRMATTEEIKEAMLEVDIDDSGTVDFFEFLCVARLISQGKGEAKLFKKKTLTALQKPNGKSTICSVQ